MWLAFITVHSVKEIVLSYQRVGGLLIDGIVIKDLVNHLSEFQVHFSCLESFHCVYSDFV